MNHRPLDLSRREMLKSSGLGFGSLALAGLLQDSDLLANESNPKFDLTMHGDLKTRAGHRDGKARAVIQLFQNGGRRYEIGHDPRQYGRVWLRRGRGQGQRSRFARHDPAPDGTGSSTSGVPPRRTAGRLTDPEVTGARILKELLA